MKLNNLHLRQLPLRKLHLRNSNSIKYNKLVRSLNYSQLTQQHEGGKVESISPIRVPEVDLSAFPRRRDKEGDPEKETLNPCNIQMISNEHHRHLFPGTPREPSNPQVLSRIRKHLESHHLWGQEVNPAPAVDIKLPFLYGENIDQHFKEIAIEQTKDYKAGIKRLLVQGIPERPTQWLLQEGWTKYPKFGPPVKVPYPDGDAFVFDIEVCQSTGQVPTMAAAVSCDAWFAWCSPILVSGTQRDPTEPVTLNDLIPFETTAEEGPEVLRDWRKAVIIGHHVSYDRARIKEQYFLNQTNMRFLDTMSMHIAVSGITSFQRALKMSINKGLKNTTTVSNDDILVNGELDWNETSALNNLNDVYKLYCQGEELPKEAREMFITGKISDIKSDFQNLMNYCSRDVEATYEVFEKIMPMFFERFPHPVTLAGTLEMGTAYLPINQNWVRYIQTAEDKFESLQKDVKQILMSKADEALKLLPDEKYKEDPWLWDLDWKVPKTRTKKTAVSKTKKKEAKPIEPVEDPVQTPQAPPAYPKWYRNLFYKEKDEDYQPGPSKISTSMQIVPKLLRLCWFGLPLHHSKTGGWGFLIKKVSGGDPTRYEELSQECESDSVPEESTESNFPYTQWEAIWEENRARLERDYNIGKCDRKVEHMEQTLKDKSEDVAQDLRDFIKGLDALTTLGLRTTTTKKDGKSSKVPTPHPKCEFRPLPHKDGGGHKVGSPLAKDFLNKIEDNILTCYSGEDVANKVVRVSKMLSYWRNNKDRIMEQIAVWFKKPKQAANGEIDVSEGLCGAIIPQVIVSGTLTRRAVERTWMTASNAYKDRVGSELKGMIQAPDDYHFVGADVDSQELWIASVIGDAHFGGIHGCTALGWMTLQGSKSNGTDMHSKTASLIGIERDQAKILNYGRIYGAGVNFAERLLLQFNPKMSPSDARTKARAMYSMTKGERKYILNQEGRELAREHENFESRIDQPFTKREIQQILRRAQRTPGDYVELIEAVVWDGGTESHMFNRLEAIAQEERPRTPVLHCSITRSLVPSAVQNNFMTSRVNWVVQSSAVDYLHLMLTCMRWLIEKHGIKGRFAISVHDEVRYLVASEDRYRAALALQITNIFTRAMCSYQLGIYDLPQSVAFFSCVDIDKVLRKEVTQDCKTPSNPDGLAKGYGIPMGEALDIYSLIKKTGKEL